MAKPKAIITGHDGREVSIITKAENVLFDNGDTAQSILETDRNKTFTPIIKSSKSMFKVGQGDSVDYSANVADGAYESCVLKGRTLVNLISSQTPIKQTLVTNDYEIKYLKASTKYMAIFTITSNGENNRAGILIDDATWNSENILCQTGLNKIILATTSETTIGVRIRHSASETTQITSSHVVLIEYQDGMENWDIPYFTGMCDVKSPILTNVNMLDTLQEGYKSNILTCETYFDEVSQSDKVIVLRSLPNEVFDTLNVNTGEYIVEIGERAYQIGDLELLDVYTDGVTTHYKLTTPIVRKVSLSGYPYAYKDGHVIVSSGSTEQSLTPKIEYSLVTNRNGQIQVNQKMVVKQQKQLDYLEKVIVANVVVSSYEQTLTSLNYELSRV